MTGLYYQYLGPVILSGFGSYKYCSIDTSPLSNYVMHPFWNQVVKLCPLWVAPNLLTLVGLISCFLHWLILTVLDPTFLAGSPALSSLVPPAVWGSAAILLFLAHTADGIDGKQARRTNTAGPIGELMDHGLDSWAANFVTCSSFHIFDRTDDQLSMSLFRMFCLLCWVHFCTLVCHWEKYNTGVFYLPWTYDICNVAGILLYLIKAFGVKYMIKLNIPGLDPALVIQGGLYTGTVGLPALALAKSLHNIRKSYKEGTGEMRSFTEATRPLVPITVAIVITLIWVINSTNNILEVDPACFFFMSGIFFANICCELIICQMSHTRSRMVSFGHIPVSIAVAACLIARPSQQLECAILYVLTGVLLLGHLHMLVCVLLELCQYFNVRPFHIKNQLKYHGHIHI